MTAEPNQYRCDQSCKSFDNSNEEDREFDLILCKKSGELVEPVFREETKRYGCASHSDFQSEREKVLDEVLSKLTDAIDERTRTFKGLHLAIKIVRELRGKVER